MRKYQYRGYRDVDGVWDYCLPKYGTPCQDETFQHLHQREYQQLHYNKKLGFQYSSLGVYLDLMEFPILS